MMKPYLVSAVQESGITVKETEPVTLIDHICSETTLRQLKECLEGVCTDPEGTAHSLFHNSFYKVAGKTGTALVANGPRGYADHIYQASFVGYFPADHPKYTCIVVIKNHPFAKVYLGAKVAGPVFKELADKLMSVDPDLSQPPGLNRDSSRYYYAGYTRDIRQVQQTFDLAYSDSAAKNEWSRLYASNEGGRPVLNRELVSRQAVPDVKGMGLKDALYLLEGMDLKVAVRGSGRVKVQSLQPGSACKKNETILIQLD
jgi:cell division protein FtsI (penicillin-binding protein 3)